MATAYRQGEQLVITVGFSKLYSLSSELYSEIDKYFVITEIRKQFPNFEIQIACLPRNIKDSEEKPDSWRSQFYDV